MEQPGQPQDQPFGSPPGAPYPGQPIPHRVYPEESQALTALLFSLLGLVVCSGLLCPVGWWISNKELAAIDQGRRDPSKRDMAVAGKVIGIVGTALLALGVVFLFGMVILVVIGAAAGA